MGSVEGAAWPADDRPSSTASTAAERRGDCSFDMESSQGHEKRVRSRQNGGAVFRRMPGEYRV